MYKILIYALIFSVPFLCHANDVASTIPEPIVDQFATINPKDNNPLDYQDKIENTIYQSGDRLIVIQSIPLKYIKEAIEPNTQPTINDFPSF